MQEKSEETIKRVEKILIDMNIAKGFIFFCGILTDEKNEDGNYKIKYHYERSSFGLEDAGKALKVFKNHFYHDLEGK